MSSISERDPREVLVRDKYFSLRPKPLERWIWAQNLPATAERVFWVHWAAGMQRGDWCSELSLRQVATECHADTSTVTRSYQLLRRLGLLRREDPGRDARRPFQQAIAITEVRIPRELLLDLGRAPNRHQPKPAARQTHAATSPSSEPKIEQKPLEQGRRLDRVEFKAILQKLSAAENSAYFLASRDRRGNMSFDAESRLSSDERSQVLRVLAATSAEMPSTSNTAPASRTGAKCFAQPRKFSPLDAARLRKSILLLVPGPAAQEVFTQVLWSVEEGVLRQFAPAMGANIALKKIREGAWTRPHRMPPNWMRGTGPEACSAA